MCCLECINYLIFGVRALFVCCLECMNYPIFGGTSFVCALDVLSRQHSLVNTSKHQYIVLNPPQPISTASRTPCSITIIFFINHIDNFTVFFMDS